MDKNYLRFVIVGHVDHGKSTLIGRLLFETNSLPNEKITEIKTASRELGGGMEFAFLADQLKEERENRMTLDTTQTFFSSRRMNYAIIDSPGHAALIKNMLTGASLAEAAVLAIDVNEGIQEQTTRHASLVSLLGIRQLIVVLNKMDLVSYKEKPFNEIKDKVSGFLGSVGIKPAAVIPVSAKDGVYLSKKSPLIPWYKGPCLLEALDSLPRENPKDRKPLRFPIQDIYEINNEKILVGRIVSGKMKQGQEIVSLPSFAEEKIRAVKMYGKSRKNARAGENVGITFSEPLRTGRGEIIVEKAHAPRPCDFFEGKIFWMGKEPLPINTPVNFRCATQETQCVIERIKKRIDSSTLEVLEEDAAALKKNETGIVMVKTEKPVVIEKFDFIDALGRFVLERNFNLEGAGIIT